MTEKTIDWAPRYLEALQSHLESRGRGRIASAKVVGRGAGDAGCTPRALVRMHERALTALTPTHDLANRRNGLFRRSTGFLIEALLSLMAYTGASNSEPGIRAALRLAAAESARDKRRLKREIARRETAEAAVKAGKARYRRLSEQSVVMQTKLRSLAHQLLEAQEQERRKISRELHDQVVQTLVGINVELATLGHAASFGSRNLKSKIVSTQRLVEKSVIAVHQFARDLRPAVLDDLGLIPALKTFMQTISARQKLLIRLTAFSGVESIPDPRRIVLYRVAQEALTNVVRHAKATLVKVDIRPVDDGIRMEIRDNGKSFRVARKLTGKGKNRLGLVGMRERVEMVGGTFSIASAPGEGTTVRADIPNAPGGAS